MKLSRRPFLRPLALDEALQHRSVEAVGVPKKQNPGVGQSVGLKRP